MSAWAEAGVFKLYMQVDLYDKRNNLQCLFHTEVLQGVLYFWLNLVKFFFLLCLFIVLLFFLHLRWLK